MNTKQNLEQPLHLTGREDYSFANVCSIFKRGRKPFNLRPGVYKIGEEPEVKRYFEKYYVSQQWFILTHDKSKRKKYFKADIPPEDLAQEKQWKKDWIDHYAGFFVSPQGILHLFRIYEAGKQTTQRSAKTASFFKRLKIKEDDLECLTAIATRSLYYQLRKIATQEKENNFYGPSRLTFWGNKKKPLFHLKKILLMFK